MEELKEKRAADQKALRKLYAKKGLCTGIYFAAAALIEIVTFGVLGFGGGRNIDGWILRRSLCLPLSC